MRDIVVYGTGGYCKRKINNVDGNVMCFCDRESGLFMGKEIVPISKISETKFDKIVVLVRHIFLRDVVRDLVNTGVNPEKIELGIQLAPKLLEELELCRGSYLIEQNGIIEYISEAEDVIYIKENSDWEAVRKLNTSIANVETLRRMDFKPVSKTFGTERGGSIVRYYISKFFEQYSKYINGDVLEIGDNYYTRKYGKNDARSHILIYGDSDSIYENGSDDYFIGDFMDVKSFKSRKFDCVILTQVMNFMEDISDICETLDGCLRENGTALITVSGITPICRADMEDYGQYWCFTDMSMKRIFRNSSFECTVETYGNLKCTCAFLAGMGCGDLDPEDLDYRDEDYQLIICVALRKK